jgi:hypothetical protein
MGSASFRLLPQSIKTANLLIWNIWPKFDVMKHILTFGAISFFLMSANFQQQIAPFRTHEIGWITAYSGDTITQNIAATTTVVNGMTNYQWRYVTPNGNNVGIAVTDVNNGAIMPNEVYWSRNVQCYITQPNGDTLFPLQTPSRAYCSMQGDTLRIDFSWCMLPLNGLNANAYVKLTY